MMKKSCLHLQVILLYLLQVQKCFSEIKCEVSNWNSERLQCLTTGNVNNIITDKHVRSNMVHYTLVQDFGKYNWNIISTLVMKDLNLISIHKDLFVNATYLRNLDLSDNPNLCFVGDEFEHLKSLQTLRLSGSGKCAGNNLLNKVNNLFSLDVSNLILDLDSFALRDLKSFSNLRVIDVSRNKHIDFNTFNIGTSVNYVNASYTKVTLGNMCFENSTQMKILLLSHSDLYNIPKDTFRGTSLHDLDMSYNHLKVEDLRSLTGMDMKRVNLSHNNISELDRRDMFSSNIEILDLSYNNINSTHLETFWISTNLTYLNLAHNNLSWLYEKQLNENYNLKSLDLSYNAIQSFYILFFSSLENLEVLNLSGNLLQTIETSLLENNKKLTTLLVCDNRLSNLNILAFVPLQNLKMLDLRKNLLKRLPDNLAQIGKIRYLNVSCNLLSYLPGDYFKGNFGLQVSLQGNPWKCACLFTLLNSLRDVSIERRYFLDGSYPTCYIGNSGYSRHAGCNDNYLNELDYKVWNKSMLSNTYIQC